MRVGSPPPVSGKRTVQPVSPAERADPADRRPAGRPRPGDGPVTTADAAGLGVLTAGAAPSILAGIVAQSVYHARFGGRPEESSVHAARAYLRTSDLAFRDEPGILRVA